MLDGVDEGKGLSGATATTPSQSHRLKMAVLGNCIRAWGEEGGGVMAVPEQEMKEQGK